MKKTNKRLGHRIGGKEPRKLDAHVTITRQTDAKGQHVAAIRIEEVLSGCIVADVTMSMENFAEGLFSVGNRPAKLTFFDGAVERLGKKSETKTVQVPCKVGALPTPKDLKALEVDGWIVADEDYNQHHCTSDGKGGGSYRITLHRWIEQW